MNTARLPEHRRAHLLHGFTLLELVIVMAVLAIIAAITVPSLRGFLTGSYARDASTQIISLTQYARAKSAADSTVYRLNFDLASNTYWLTVQDAGNFNDLGTEMGTHFDLPPGMRVELTHVVSQDNPATRTVNNGTSIDFRPDGSSDTLIIRLTDADGQLQTIGSPSAGEAYRLMSEQEVSRL